jgi:hypothetical protein
MGQAGGAVHIAVERGELGIRAQDLHQTLAGDLGNQRGKTKQEEEEELHGYSQYDQYDQYRTSSTAHTPTQNRTTDQSTREEGFGPSLIFVLDDGCRVKSPLSPALCRSDAFLRRRLRHPPATTNDQPGVLLPRGVPWQSMPSGARLGEWASLYVVLYVADSTSSLIWNLEERHSGNMVLALGVVRVMQLLLAFTVPSAGPSILD